MSLHCTLICVVSEEGSAVLFLFLYNMTFFPLDAFKIFSSSFLYNCLNATCLGVFCLVVLILSGILWAFWIGDLMSLILGISQPLFLQIFLFILHFLSHISWWHSSVCLTVWYYPAALRCSVLFLFCFILVGFTFFLSFFFFSSAWVMSIEPTDLVHCPLFLLKPLAYLIIVILNSLSDTSNICDISVSGSNNCFVSWVFPCLFTCLVIFY